MSNLTYNGQIIEQRVSDNYVNLSQMAKANNVRFADYIENQKTQDYLKALQGSICAKNGINDKLTITQGFGADKATWGHPLVAIAFGQWISPEFHVWCNMHIQTLMTQGYVALPQIEQPKLSSEDKAVKVAKAVDEIQNLLSHNNPRLAQFLIDYAISDIMPSQNVLTGDRLRGVAEIAVDLGYSVDIKNRSQLGKFVKKTCGELAQQEKRLVNGQDRVVACYPESHPDIIAAIHQFFS